MPRYYARPPTRVPTQMRDAAHPAQAGRIVASGRHRDTREDPKSTYTTPLCSSCLRGRNPLPVREFWLPRRLPSTFTASGSHRVSTSKLRLSGGGNVHSGVHVSVVPGAIYGSTPGCDEMSICDIPKLTAAKSSLCDIARVLARIGETGGPESARGIRAIGSSPCSLLRRLLRQTGYTHKGAFLRLVKLSKRSQIYENRLGSELLCYTLFTIRWLTLAHTAPSQRTCPHARVSLWNGLRHAAQRSPVETVNAQFAIGKHGAHTSGGLGARLEVKLTAHTLCLALNRQMGKAAWLQIKALAFPL